MTDNTYTYTDTNSVYMKNAIFIVPMEIKGWMAE